MKAERTKNSNDQGWVLYDGHCAICNRQVNRWKTTFQHFGFEFVPQQAEWVQQRLGLTGGQVADEIKVLTCDGRIRGGLDAVLYLVGFIWWVRPAVFVARLPGIFHLLRALYRQIAKRRYCIGGTCEIRNL